MQMNTKKKRRQETETLDLGRQQRILMKEVLNLPFFAAAENQSLDYVD